LNQKETLESLEVENRFAKIAVKSVLENPGRLYNPLYLYGAGKEKMLSAVHNEIQEKYTEADVLLIEDLEQVEENMPKQKEVLDILNHRLEEHKQVIIFANKPPKELKLDDRLKARLTWGLTIDVR